MTKCRTLQESYLHEMPNPLMLNGYIHDHNLTLDSFIYLFFAVLVSNHKILTTNVMVNYFIEGDDIDMKALYLTTKFYYPDATLFDVLRIMVRLKHRSLSDNVLLNKMVNDTLSKLRETKV